MARELLQRGAGSVVLLARTASKLEAAVESLGDAKHEDLEQQV